MGREVIPTATSEEIALMKKILDKGDISYKYAVRIQTILNRADGRTTTDTAAALGIHPVTVSQYVHRFNEGGVDALIKDKTRKPGKEPVSQEIKNELCRIVCQEKPQDATHWSTRELARRVGLSHNTVSLILRERGLKPHLVKSFQISTVDFPRNSRHIQATIV